MRRLKNRRSLDPPVAKSKVEARSSRREVEGRGPLLEELSLLGEEQREPSQVDLFIVGLDLGEVRVHGEVQRQVGGG
jgi:hypothetical protein